MSLYVIDWVIRQAPTADIYESHILAVMASRADNDGCGAFVSIPTMAKSSHCDERTVYRRLEKMRKRGLIGPGDPLSPGAARWRKRRAGHRPPLYDILVPAEWYSAQQLEAFNEDRAAAGRELITPETRPPIALPPPKKARADKGKKYPERTKAARAARAAAAAEESDPEPAETDEGGLLVTPPDPVDNSSRGDYESQRGVTTSHSEGCLQVTQLCKGTLSLDSVSGGASRRPPTPPADLTAGRVESVVTSSGDYLGDQQTARADELAELAIVVPDPPQPDPAPTPQCAMRPPSASVEPRTPVSGIIGTMTLDRTGEERDDEADALEIHRRSCTGWATAPDADVARRCPRCHPPRPLRRPVQDYPEPVPSARAAAAYAAADRAEGTARSRGDVVEFPGKSTDETGT